MRGRQAIPMLILAALLFAAGMTAAQPDLVERSEFTGLEEKVDRLEDRRGEKAGGCGLAVLFGAFCALWAQNTGRSPWLWFLCGVLFSVITVLVLLYKNAMDRQGGRPIPPAPLPGLVERQTEAPPPSQG